jgi:four helix bundle protein
MHGARSYDELDVYQLAVSLRRRVVQITRVTPCRHDFKFVDQIRNSARGGPRNISEGFSRFVPTEFHRFLSYAKASLDETLNHLADGYESGYFTRQEYEALVSLTRRTLAAIRGLMRYLESPQAWEAYKAIVRNRTGAPPLRNGRPQKKKSATRNPHPRTEEP